MRVSSDVGLLDVRPGERTDFQVDVVNTGAVIDGVTARVVGLPEHLLTSRPAVLPLFPDSGGRMTLSLGLPAGFPAGLHPVTVEVRSRQAETGPEYLDLDVLVPSMPGLGLSAMPQVVRSRRTARYVLTVANRGNTALDVALSAADPERSVAATMEPPRLSLAPATAADVVLTARGPRMILGTELDRTITVTATARVVQPGEATAPAYSPALPTPPAPATHPDPTPVPAEPGAPGVPPDSASDEAAEEPLTAICPLTLKQRPWLTRGLLTALILLAIIAGWAAVFLFGLGQVFAGDPITKTANESFFEVPGQVTVAEVEVQLAAESAAEGSADGSTDGSGGSDGSGSSDGSGGAGSQEMPPPVVPAVPPAGALPKDGSMPPGMAGSITGTVTAESSGEPVGRIMVSAVRISVDEPKAAASAATQADGSFQVSGLFPGEYYLKFSATGFDEIWYPAATAIGGAEPVNAESGAITPGINVVITGQPATISGSVDPGDTTEPIVTTVTVRQLSGTALGEQVGKPVKTAQNKYVIAEPAGPGQLPAHLHREGLRAHHRRVDVGGGTQRLQPTTAATGRRREHLRHGHRRRDPARRDHRDHNGAGRGAQHRHPDHRRHRDVLVGRPADPGDVRAHLLREGLR